MLQRDTLQARRRRRAFTVLELAVSLTVFAIIAGITTLAVARAQMTSANSRLEMAVRAELTSLVETTGTAQYMAVADSSFDRPDPCPQNSALSCVTVLGREFQVDWAVTAAPDLADLSAENPATVRLSASTTLPGQRSVTVTRTIVSPNAGVNAATGLLRVVPQGASYDGPVYLMREANAGAGETGEQVAASGRFTNGWALMRADAADCTSSAPCRLALAPDGSTRSGDLTMDAASAIGSTSQIVLTPDAVAEASLILRPIPQLRVGLQAVSPEGQRGYPDQAGSVCAWLKFTDDNVVRAVPACNDPAPHSLLFTTYTPDPSQPEREVAIPTQAAFQLSADKPDGTCPDLTALGQVSWNGTAWVSASACTSWTWGPIGGVIDGRDPADPIGSTSFTTDNAVTELQAVWNDDDLARAATGLDAQTPWSFPRTMPGCAVAATCTPPSSAPEATCPDSQCLSGGPNAPYTVTPRNLGTWTVKTLYTPAGVATAVPIKVSDADPSAIITVRALSAPSGLTTVTFDGAGNPVYTAVTTNQILGTVGVNTTITLTYTAPPNSTGAVFSVQLSDDGGATTTENILLWNTRAREFGYASAGIVRQGESVDLLVTTLDQAGDPTADVTALTATPPSGSSLSGWTSAGAGTVQATLSVASTPAGQYDIPVAVSPRHTINIPVTVLPAAGSVSITAAGAAQGGEGAAAATVLDRSGMPMQGADVVFNVTEPVTENPALGVYAQPRGCRTAANGTCGVPLTVERAVAPGSYDVQAQVGELTTVGTPIQVTSTVAWVVSTGATISQGDTGTTSVKVTDARGQPAPGVSLTVSDVPDGVAVAVRGSTDAGGFATVDVAVERTAPAGVALFRVTAPGGAYSTVRVVVKPIVDVVDADGVDVPQGGNATVELTARDPAGNPVPSATLNVLSQGGLRAGLAVTTNSEGKATVALQATTTAATLTDDLPVVWQGQTVGAIRASVIQGVTSVVVSGALKRGESSSITLTLADGDGTPVGERAFSFRVNNPQVTPNSAGELTDSLGRTTIDLTTDTQAATGFTTITVTVDGRSIIAGVAVL